MPWQATIVSDYGSFSELSEMDPDRSSGRGHFFTAFVPPRYHELHFTKSTQENARKRRSE
jgi:hypothetical protein